MTVGRMSCARGSRAFGVALVALSLGAGTAAADPEPLPGPLGPGSEIPAPAAPPPPPPDPFAVASTQSKDNPVGTLAGLLGPDAAGSTAEMANQGVGLTGTPPYDPLAAIGALSAQNFRMPSGEEVSPYVLQTNVPPGPFARVDAFKGAHALGHAGLGRVPGFLLGQPLPGVEPPPGFNLPAGLEQFYLPPEAPAAVAPPAPLFPPDAPVG